MEEIRLNKYLSEMGICSRREADRYVEEGRITVNGRPAELGQKITEADELLLLVGPQASSGRAASGIRNSFLFIWCSFYLL